MDTADVTKIDFMTRMRGYFSRERNLIADDDGPPRRTLAIVVCIILSCLLWLTFSMQETQELVIPLNVQLENMPADRMLADSLPRTIRVTVEAERIQLLRLLWNSPPVRINVSQPRIVVEDVLPSLAPARIQGVSPNVIEPRLEAQLEARLPIVLRHNITTPASHDFLVLPQITPDSVVVSGAETIVENLVAWPTAVFAYDGLEDTLRARVPLSDTLGTLVRKRPSEVMLTAVAGLFVGAVREIDVHVQGVPSGEEQVVVLDPPTVSVRYRVLFSDYDQAETAPDFYALVTYDQIRSDNSGYVRPELNIPENLEIRDAEMVPPTVGYFDVVSDQ